MIAYCHIDPDVGVDEDIAQFYFMQLLDAIVQTLVSPSNVQKFCHGKGVAHRGSHTYSIMSNLIRYQARELALRW